MRAHLEAIRGRLAAAGLTSYVVDVPDVPALPYALLSPGVAAPHPDMQLDGASPARVIPVLVTAVAGTPDGALIVADRVRGALIERDARTALPVPGRQASIRWLRTELVDVDRAVHIPGTNRHPAFCKDSYRVDSTPA